MDIWSINKRSLTAAIFKEEERAKKSCKALFVCKIPEALYLLASLFLAAPHIKCFVWPA
jgi:hypothetical protein